MTKLNQIVAVEKGLKARSATALTEIYHDLQKPALFSGISRVYSPIDDEGEKLPSEATRVQQVVEDRLRDAASHLTQLFDVVATKEHGNLVALADVKVDGEIILHGVPVPYLLFLEKQLQDLRTVVRRLPTLDPAVEWNLDDATGQYRTPPAETSRTRKVPRVLVKAAATDKHPAQTEVYMEDETVGRWATTKLSGAVTLKRQQELLSRVDALADAVKAAREQANGTEITQVKPGEKIFDYLLA